MEFVDWIVKQTGKISDNFNKYKFYVKHQPQVIDSSSVVSLNTYVSRDMTATVPCSFKWFKIRNQVTTQISQFKGNTYICEPNDVGCYLQIQITSSDVEYNGTAIIRLGPIKFDVLLKKEIQMALSLGQSFFYVDVSQINKTKECQFRISQEKMSINHINPQISYSFSYCMIEPKIELTTKVLARISIVFNIKYQQQIKQFLLKLFGEKNLSEELLRNPYLQINFRNRKARDSFMFIAKAFNTKKQLKSSSYATLLQKQINFSDFSSQKWLKNYDYIEQISELHYDIKKLLQMNSKNYAEKRVYLEEIKRLQKQIEEIVSTYLKIIQQKFQGREDFEKSFVVLKEKEEEIKSNKLFSKEVESKHERIWQLEKENQELKQKIKVFLQSTSNSEGKQIKNQRIGAVISFAKKSPILYQQSVTQVQQRAEIEGLIKENSLIKQEKQRIEQKYNQLLNLYEQKIVLSRQNTTQNKPTKEENFDLFDAKSVKSIKSNQADNNASSLLLSKDSILMINPQKLKFSSTSPKKNIKDNEQLYSTIKELHEQNNQLKNSLTELQTKLQLKQQEMNETELKYKKKINQLNEEIEMYKRNNDVLNRSQNLSYEMSEYNQQEKAMLKNQNSFLVSENERLQQLCKRYIGDAKKYKQLKKNLQVSNAQNTQLGVKQL